MLTARRHNLTEPTQNVWYTVDLFNASYFGHGAWQRGDQYDLDAYEAYKGTFFVFFVLLFVSEVPPQNEKRPF